MVNRNALELLNLLKESPTPLAGPALSSRLGISRVALWKRMETLRQAGYTIEAGRHGYSLSPTDLVRPWEFPGSEASIHSFTTLGSTMDTALELALGGHGEGTLVQADVQQAGRGQAGRPWQSLEGNLSFTLLIKPALPLGRIGAVSLEALCQLAEILDELYGLDCRLKWPNDLVVQEKKVAGILVEAVGSAEHARWFTVGVGLNVRQVPALDRPVGSVEALSGRHADRRDIVRLFRDRMSAWSLRPESTPRRWFARHVVRPWTLETSDGQVLRGIPTGFDLDGSLFLSESNIRFGNAKSIEGVFL